VEALELSQIIMECSISWQTKGNFCWQNLKTQQRESFSDYHHQLADNALQASFPVVSVHWFAVDQLAISRIQHRAFAIRNWVIRR